MKKIMKGLLAGLVILASASVNSAPVSIDGSMSIGGNYVCNRSSWH